MKPAPKQNIFEDEEDRSNLLNTLERYKTISGYQIYGYCLMSNHVHLLVQEISESISLALKRICSSYVYRYNYKYERCGHLFQERFRSESVEADAYFIAVLRYIHQNPLKAGLVKSVFESKWTSYSEYLHRKNNLVDIDFGLSMFSSDREKARESFIAYMNEQNEDKYLDDEEGLSLSDDEVRECIYRLGITTMSTLQQMRKMERDEVLSKTLGIEGISIRQLARVTGISKSVIGRLNVPMRLR